MKSTETFCACGHDFDEHDEETGLCLATEPDPHCSCRGYRRGSRARG